MIVVTFHTTADAFAFEAACKKAAVPGRLGTVPRNVSATCGFAWIYSDEASGSADAMRAFAGENGLEVEGVFSV